LDRKKHAPIELFEIAARGAQGPGSFAAATIDALHGIDRGALPACVKAS